MDISTLAQYLPALGQVAGNVMGQANVNRQTRPYYFAGDMSGMGSKLITPYQNRALALEERKMNQMAGANISEMLRGISNTGGGKSLPTKNQTTSPYVRDNITGTRQDFLTSDQPQLGYLGGGYDLDLPSLRF